ncbi:hypothetical protein Tco_1063951 [Tanacetum coccineum]
MSQSSYSHTVHTASRTSRVSSLSGQPTRSFEEEHSESKHEVSSSGTSVLALVVPPLTSINARYIQTTRKRVINPTKVSITWEDDA